MKNMYLVGFSVFLSMSIACTAETDQDKDERSQHNLSGDAPEVTPVPTPGPGPSPEPAPAPPPLCKPVSSPSGGGIGLANPASVYCANLGYSAEGGTCTFPDGSSCDQWGFFRGECGQAHSFCNRNGGQVSPKTEDMDGWMATYALCTLPTGASCKEQDFATSCKCE